MFKTAKIMFMYGETSLHCGSGQSFGVIDLPIQRERHTEYPLCQASGVKGVVREFFEAKYGQADNRVKHALGPDFSRGDEEAFAGAAAFSDARLLLFPVRSLNRVFGYTTSLFALNRLKRDLALAGIDRTDWLAENISTAVALLPPATALKSADGKLILEEYAIDCKEQDEIAVIAQWLAEKAFPAGAEYEFWRDKVKKDLVVLPDDIFRDFVKLATEVQARVRIDSKTKTVAEHALFYEEALPSEALLYSVVMAHDPACDTNERPEGLKDSSDVMRLLAELDGQRLQFGGDAALGKGIVNIRFLNGGL